MECEMWSVEWMKSWECRAAFGIQKSAFGNAAAWGSSPVAIYLRISTYFVVVSAGAAGGDALGGVNRMVCTFWVSGSVTSTL